MLDDTCAEASTPGVSCRQVLVSLELLSYELRLVPEDQCSVPELVEGATAKWRFDKLSDRKAVLTLTLLVTRVRLADDHDVSVTTNDAALLADRLDAWVDLHCVSLFAVFDTGPRPRSLLSSSPYL